jgi:hypothetical protein
MPIVQFKQLINEMSAEKNKDELETSAITARRIYKLIKP